MVKKLRRERGRGRGREGGEDRRGKEGRKGRERESVTKMSSKCSIIHRYLTLELDINRKQPPS